MKSRFRRRISWAGSLAVIGLAACSSNPLGPDGDALEAARARWAETEPGAYVFQFRRSCFCGPSVLREIRIDVIHGVVVAAVHVDDGQPVDEPLSEVPTIDDLFDEIQAALDRDAHELVAAYDENFGYPTNVAIDFILQAVDEEMAFQVTSFDVLALPETLRRAEQF